MTAAAQAKVLRSLTVSSVGRFVPVTSTSLIDRKRFVHSAGEAGLKLGG